MARKPKLHVFSNRYLLKRSIGYFKPYKGRVTLAAISMLLLSPISPALAWIGKYVMDDVLIAKDMKMLKLCIGGFLGLWLIRGQISRLHFARLDMTSRAFYRRAPAACMLRGHGSILRWRSWAVPSLLLWPM